MSDHPATRGWPQLRHNLVHDLAALDKTEMLLWEDWGVPAGNYVLSRVLT